MFKFRFVEIHTVPTESNKHSMLYSGWTDENANLSMVYILKYWRGI